MIASTACGPAHHKFVSPPLFSRVSWPVFFINKQPASEGRLFSLEEMKTDWGAPRAHSHTRSLLETKGNRQRLLIYCYPGWGYREEEKSAASPAWKNRRVFSRLLLLGSSSVVFSKPKSEEISGKPRCNLSLKPVTCFFFQIIERAFFERESYLNGYLFPSGVFRHLVIFSIILFWSHT